MSIPESCQGRLPDTTEGNSEILGFIQISDPGSTARTFYYNKTFWGTAKNKLNFECFKWVVDIFYSLNFEIIDSFT